MRQVILQEFVSLDGMAAGPNDSVDFVPASTRGDRAFGQEQLALMDTIDAILLGRKTYSMFAAYWPNATEGGADRRVQTGGLSRRARGWSSALPRTRAVDRDETTGRESDG